MVSPVFLLLLSLSHGSLTSQLSVHGPGRVRVDRQLAPCHLAGGQACWVRGEETQPGVLSGDLIHGPVCELVHSQEVTLCTRTVLNVVILN